ncbi:serine/arginine repetitive matrix protein 1 [Brachypodium distachyon]|uniref:Uncharacterized protein n=1 Tax=Brachypodium distachyon TaxID=15368 RepID=I1HS92_BRADI|nr:serine/arginine repetitive matrix protein 1 [Brachypodium distachyon]KQK10069.1 hypothetical protein BRADI_2g51750v3 [Brachypodium distachyon]|eukprot:XP_003564352.1 serine/arginine repetitive matrix protein 1 [Brachypodium distachyon]
MGCCFSKKRPDGSAVFPPRCKPEDRDPPPPPSPEEEKVKEVLSETPNTKVTVEPNKPAAIVVAVEEQRVLKVVKASADATTTASDLGSCMSLATDERSEAASESSVATSSVAGPERSPRKPATRKRPVSGELGVGRRDRAAAAAYGVRSRSCRASPSPPPRREPRDRSVRRSPSPAAKRPPQEQNGAAGPAPFLQRKPPVPSRSCSRASPRRAREAPPPPPQPGEEREDGAMDANASHGDGQGEGDGDGKESLANPLVSMECFIFL